MHLLIIEVDPSLNFLRRANNFFGKILVNHKGVIALPCQRRYLAADVEIDMGNIGKRRNGYFTR